MKMRDMIRIVEDAVRIVEGDRPKDPTILYRLAEIVSDFVSHAPVTDDLMDEVMHHWPRPDAPMKLWRVHVLSKKQVAQLTQGLTVPVHRYLSWTKDHDTLARLAAARTRTGIPVIIEMTFPPEDICVDVQQFVSDLYDMEGNSVDPSTGHQIRLDFDLGDVVQYDDEAEVIVAHHHPLQLSTTNTMVFKRPKSAAPKPGDKVYRPHVLSDDVYEITAVLGKNRDGTWKIEWYEGEDDVRNVAPGEWEVVVHYG